MAVELTYPHIEKPPGEPARLRRLPRIRVAQIAADYLAYGWSADEMCRQHPYLTMAEAHAAMAYYFDHERDMEREIREEAARLDREDSPAGRSPFFRRMRSRGAL